MGKQSAGTHLLDRKAVKARLVQFFQPLPHFTAIAGGEVFQGGSAYGFFERLQARTPSPCRGCICCSCVLIVAQS